MFYHRFLEPAPFRKITRQPVHIADNHHVDFGTLDRLDQVDEIVPLDSLNAEYPSSLKRATTCPAAPLRVLVRIGANTRWADTSSNPTWLTIMDFRPAY